MPDAAQMRVLEERWLDNDSAPSSSSAVAGGAGAEGTGTGGGGVFGAFTAGGNQTVGDGGAGGFGGGGDEDAGALDDLLWGNVVGFFWPVGAVVWLMREEGVWSNRRQIAVLTGFLVNLAVCIVRAAG